MTSFFQIFLFGRKNHTFGYLEGIWRQFGRTKYLVIWLFEQIDELRQAPIDHNFFYAICTQILHEILPFLALQESF